MILHRAAWVVPIAGPPLPEGWVLTANGRIVACGTGDPSAASGGAAFETNDLGDAAILPGLVNAHTHLELSWMRDRVPPAESMPDWASRLIELRRTVTSEPPGPIAGAVAELRAAGTALVGDVTNMLEAYDILADSGVAAVVFRELLGFAVQDGDPVVATAQAELDRLTPLPELHLSIVPHAPYSVSPALFRAIGRAAGDHPISVHVAESVEEMQFLRDGTGAWRDLLEQLGAWTDAWMAPVCGPVEYLERLGLLSDRLIAVHGTHLEEKELAQLAAAGATLVTCPRSNRWTGAGTPSIERFYASGVRVAIGTDSLASVEDLNLFAELAAVRRLAPDIAAKRLLESGTIHGAAALGFGADLGTIEAGKRADLIAVRVPAGLYDVEEYLVGGIEPDAVRWLDGTS